MVGHLGGWLNRDNPNSQDEHSLQESHLSVSIPPFHTWCGLVIVIAKWELMDLSAVPSNELFDQERFKKSQWAILWLLDQRVWINLSYAELENDVESQNLHMHLSFLAAKRWRIKHKDRAHFEKTFYDFRDNHLITEDWKLQDASYRFECLMKQFKKRNIVQLSDDDIKDIVRASDFMRNELDGQISKTRMYSGAFEDKVDHSLEMTINASVSYAKSWLLSRDFFIACLIHDWPEDTSKNALWFKNQFWVTPALISRILTKPTLIHWDWTSDYLDEEQRIKITTTTNKQEKKLLEREGKNRRNNEYLTMVKKLKEKLWSKDTKEQYLYIPNDQIDELLWSNTVFDIDRYSKILDWDDHVKMSLLAVAAVKILDQHHNHSIIRMQWVGFEMHCRKQKELEESYLPLAKVLFENYGVLDYIDMKRSRIHWRSWWLLLKYLNEKKWDTSWLSNHVRHYLSVYEPIWWRESNEQIVELMKKDAPFLLTDMYDEWVINR